MCTLWLGLICDKCIVELIIHFLLLASKFPISFLKSAALYNVETEQTGNNSGYQASDPKWKVSLTQDTKHGSRLYKLRIKSFFAYYYYFSSHYSLVMG